MNKQEFLAKLSEGLGGLPKEDIAERVNFYSEMIDDRVEEGLTEEEAVAELGPIDGVVSQILEETPISKLIKERVKPKRSLRAWEIVLLVLGFPLWFPLLIAGFCVVFTIYVVIWALIASLWAVELAFAVSAVGCAVMGAAFLFTGRAPQGAVIIAAGLVLAGLAVFLFFGCLAATKGAALFTKKVALGIKSLFLRKENSK